MHYIILHSFLMCDGSANFPREMKAVWSPDNVTFDRDINHGQPKDPPFQLNCTNDQIRL